MCANESAEFATQRGGGAVGTNRPPGSKAEARVSQPSGPPGVAVSSLGAKALRKFLVVAGNHNVIILVRHTNGDSLPYIRHGAPSWRGT